MTPVLVTLRRGFMGAEGMPNSESLQSQGHDFRRAKRHADGSLLSCRVTGRILILPPIVG